MEWQWWVSQAFALVGLFFVIWSMQGKTRKRVLWLNTTATMFLLVGLLFLGNVSAIILMSVSVSRNITALIFAYYPRAHKAWIWITSIILATALIVLNIVFWDNWLNAISIIIGIGFIISFMQEAPRNMRLTIIWFRIIALVYFIILLAPINAVMETLGLVATIVGIIRLDLKKKKPPCEQLEMELENLE